MGGEKDNTYFGCIANHHDNQPQKCMQKYIRKYSKLLWTYRHFYNFINFFFVLGPFSKPFLLLSTFPLYLRAQVTWEVNLVQIAQINSRALYMAHSAVEGKDETIWTIEQIHWCINIYILLIHKIFIEHPLYYKPCTRYLGCGSKWYIVILLRMSESSTFLEASVTCSLREVQKFGKLYRAFLSRVCISTILEG